MKNCLCQTVCRHGGGAGLLLSMPTARILCPSDALLRDPARLVRE